MWRMVVDPACLYQRKGENKGTYMFAGVTATTPLASLTSTIKYHKNEKKNTYIVRFKHVTGIGCP